jgi:hypothetical protein
MQLYIQQVLTQVLLKNYVYFPFDISYINLVFITTLKEYLHYLHGKCNNIVLK